MSSENIRTVRIYTLKCPISNNIRYVGKTVESLERRLNKHVSKTQTVGIFNHKTNWVNSLLSKGVKPIIELLDEVPESDWHRIEKYWISQMRFWGFDLVNTCDGGQGPAGRVLSNETRYKISQSLMGHAVSEETRHKKRLKKLGSVMSISAREKISKIHKGRKRPIETGRKISQALLGKKHSKEFGENISKRMKGRVPTNTTQVDMYDKNGCFIERYQSIADAYRKTGINRTSICNNLAGLSQSAGGFVWRRVYC